MKEVDFGKRCGFTVPPVSIGAMRFPADGLDAVELIRFAIDSGLKYIDTSRGYGDSEYILGKALKNGYREKVILSSKSSPWIKKIREDDEPNAYTVRRRIEETLLRLDIEYIDFYQVWNVNQRENWDKAVAKGGMVEGILKAMDEGLVRHTGFTSHDTVENLLEYIEIADWAEIILLSYNLLNRTYEPVLEAACKKGMGTVVMNPVGGGRFAEDSPVFQKLSDDLGCRSIADLAVRFVLSNPYVNTILCGMEKSSDVVNTVKSADRGAFTDSELKTVTGFLEDITGEKTGFCTGCEYCLPCPEGIPIPSIMKLIYEDKYLNMKKAAKRYYQWIGPKKADACVGCGECEEKCTQKLGIIKSMEYAARTYG